MKTYLICYNFNMTFNNMYLEAEKPLLTGLELVISNVLYW